MSTFDIQGDYHRSEDVDVKIKEVGIAEQHIRRLAQRYLG